jgi:hypothetical protein
LTVAEDRAAGPPARTITFPAGWRNHAVNCPNCSSVTPSHAIPRTPRNTQNVFRSCAYARTVFGERSTSESHAR